MIFIGVPRSDRNSRYRRIERFFRGFPLSLFQLRQIRLRHFHHQRQTAVLRQLRRLADFKGVIFRRKSHCQRDIVFYRIFDHHSAEVIFHGFLPDVVYTPRIARRRRAAYRRQQLHFRV